MSDFLIFTTCTESQYLYDAPTSTVHPWPVPLDEAWARRVYAATTDEAFGALLAGVEPGVASRLRYVRLWRGQTAAFRTTPARPSSPLSSFDEVPRDQRAQSWAMDMVLVVSQACNLRCEYCTFSGFYPTFRTHSEQLMDWSVARKAIDLWFGIHDQPARQAYSDKRLNLVFYGGEPLTNRQVVRRTIDYARAN